MEGLDGRIGGLGLTQEESDLAAQIDGLKGLIASGAPGPALVPESNHRASSSDTEDHGVEEESADTQTTLDDLESPGLVQESNQPVKSDVPSADGDTVAQDSTRLGPVNPDVLAVVQGSAEEQSPPISFDDIEVKLNTFSGLGKILLKCN